MKYTDLQAWQKAMGLVDAVYKVTKSYPAEERFGLTSQLRRAAVSVPANIAEGHGRKATKAFLNHLSIALGSLMETETCLRISERLGYASSEDVNRLIEQSQEVGRLLNGLVRSLRTES